MQTAHDARIPLVAGNWKMHTTVTEAISLARDIAALSEAVGDAVEVMVAPPATALAAVSGVAAETGEHIRVAAQNGHWADQGAFTGEIGMPMVAELASAVIVGHSERRALFGETDENVNRKVHAAFAAGLLPIACVGETEAERDVGRADEVVSAQLDAALDGLSADEAGQLVVAYEPVWAIGTGRACDADEAGRVCALIRARIAERFGPKTGASARILYGGSVNGDNAAEYFACDDIDGALVGGASLKKETFAPIVHAAAPA